ncbi:MAG: hypothetical protein ACOCYQ_03420 [Alkalispirochaeta sp.]
MRMTRILLLLLGLILAMTVGLAAQDAEPSDEPADDPVELGDGLSEEAPEFVREMFRFMEQDEWTGRELAAFVTAARGQNWETLEDVDPATIAEAMRLAHRSRDGEERPLTGEDQADLAYELALQAQEMRRLGMDRREIAQATATATRDTIRTMQRDRVDFENGDVGEELRTRLRERTGEQMRDAAQNQRPEGRPGDAGNAAQRGADRQPENAPGGRSGDSDGGRADGTDRPGDRVGPPDRE